MISQAQLRRQFIEKLQQHNAKEHLAARGLGLGLGRDSSGASSSTEPQACVLEEDQSSHTQSQSLGADARNQHAWSSDEKLVHGLLFDYFDKKALEHSAAVFVPEIGGVRSYVAVDTILQVGCVRAYSIYYLCTLIVYDWATVQRGGEVNVLLTGDDAAVETGDDELAKGSTRQVCTCARSELS